MVMLKNRIMLALCLGLGLVVGGCDSVKNQVAQDLDRPTKPTTEAVALDVYLDLSGSTNSLRPEIGQLVKQAIVTYPDTMRMTYSTYGKEVRELGQSLNAGPYVDEMNSNWEELPKLEPRGTHLAVAIDHAAMTARRDTSISRAVVIASDGGFEDQKQEVTEALENLAQATNVQLLVFVGVQPGNSDKLNRLTELADFAKNLRTEAPLKVIIVTLTQNDVALSDTKSGLKTMMGGQDGSK